MYLNIWYSYINKLMNNGLAANKMSLENLDDIKFKIKMDNDFKI